MCGLYWLLAGFIVAALGGAVILHSVEAFVATMLLLVALFFLLVILVDGEPESKLSRWLFGK